MTHLEWLASRGADAPAALRARVEQVFAADGSLSALPIAEALLRAGDVLLAEVLRPRTGAPRETALDLLAADACVTWAFEAAADEPGTVGARAEAAMRRIAEVAA
jgi:hypothetical protein